MPAAAGVFVLATTRQRTAKEQVCKLHDVHARSLLELVRRDTELMKPSLMVAKRGLNAQNGLKGLKEPKREVCCATPLLAFTARLRTRLT